MPVSIARKLQAHKVTHFPDLDFQVRRVALMPSHVRKFDLPGSPLKETETRSDKWRQRIGLEQTEIDAMVTLHPDELREIIIKPMSRFFDGTLALRVKQAKEQWLAKAQTIIDQQTDRDVLDATNNRLAKLREHIESEIAEINTITG